MKNTKDGKFRFSNQQMLLFAISIILFIGLIRVISQSVLFADGAYFFVFNIQNSNFLLSGGREFSNALGQLPMQIALRSGLVHNNYYLALALGLGFQFLPVVLFALSFYLIANRPKHSNFLLMSILINVGFSGSVGQSSIGISIAALLFSLLQSDFVTCKKGQIGILILALFLTRSYESTAVFIPLLVWQIFMIREVLHKKGLRFFLHSLSILLVFGMISSLQWIFFPYGGSANRDSVLNIRVLWTYPTSTVAIFLVVVTLLISSVRHRFLLVTSIFIMSVVALTPRLTISLGYEYQTRGLAILLIAAGMAIQMSISTPGSRFHYSVSPISNNHLVGMTALILCTTLNTQLNWNSFLAEFRNAVNSSVDERIAYEDIGLAPRQDLNTWAWTNPSLSLVVRGQPNSTIVENPHWYTGWDPNVEVVGLPPLFLWKE